MKESREGFFLRWRATELSVGRESREREERVQFVEEEDKIRGLG
ncbi:hypothetical protein COLO4_33964 [Corchorus olitorius]|uniref:Uncharacterized protein n=1 Tax=Corchorus olitorius TaxID=93759 RepID=A0A1R3GPJ0_9ROSI|nr:hypothetical protein COLO4_33964 [Corchorus olitorius]